MYLILQARTDQSGWHELKCIYNAMGVSYHDMAVVNIGADFVRQEQIYDYAMRAKAIIIGGLGESGYGETDPAKKASILHIRRKVVPVLRELKESDRTSILGICFGHHLLAEALGSIVEHAPDQAEVGTKSVQLNDEGMDDPLFQGLRQSFSVIQAHNDAVMALPEGATLLASSDKCHIQSFKYKNAMYGVQFHPELDSDELEYRLELYEQYTDKYVPSNERGLDKIQATRIIRNFMRLAAENSKSNLTKRKQEALVKI